MSLAIAMRRTAASFLCLFAFNAFAADVPSLTLIRSADLSTINTGWTFFAANVLGNATPELVGCGDESLFVLQRAGSGYMPVWHSPAMRSGCSGAAVGDRDGDGAPEIYVATHSLLQLFDPRTLGNALGKIEFPQTAIYEVAVGDVDLDGQLEIVVVTAADTWVYDAKTLVLEWKAAGKTGHTLLLGNIDADPQPEIVVNSDPAHVLDAVKQQEEWAYVGGFGWTFDLGNVDGDPQLEIVHDSKQSSTTLTILHGDTFATSTINLGNSFAAHVVEDANHDGQNEIVAQMDYLQKIEGFRATDGARLWSIADPSTSQWSNGLDVADFDGDGTREVAWREGTIVIGNAVTQQVEWTSAYYWRSPWHSAIADLDGDGALERVLGSSSSWTAVFDLWSGALEGTLKPAESSYWYSAIEEDIGIGQLDADPAMEIVRGSAEQIWVFDGVTYQHQWSSPHPGSGPYLGGNYLVANIDGDPLDEIIVAQTDGKVVVLNGASLIVQWSSPRLNGFIVDFALADVNADGAKDLVVATTSGFYVFRMPDGLERTFVSRLYIRAVAATDLGGGEVAVVHHDSAFTSSTATVRTYSGSTLAQQWSCTLAGPFYTDFETTAAYGMFGTQPRLAVTDLDGLRLYPLGGNSCPAHDLFRHGTRVNSIQFLEVTGDNRPEIAVASESVFELRSIGAPGEPRGDFNGDGLVTDADVDALIAYLLGGAPGAPPGADANADGRIALDDVFYLINYRHGTGNAPPPQG